MTLSELIAHLQEMQEELGDEGADPTIMIATQPSWPMQEVVSAVEMSDPLAAFYEEYGQRPEDDDSPAQDHWQLEFEKARDADRHIFFAGGWSNEYLQSGMAAQLGWR